MAPRESYQQGSLSRQKRMRGPDVWVLRYRRYGQDGKAQRIAEVVADVVECPTRSRAMKKAEEHRRRINEERVCVYFRDLARKYREDYIAGLRPHLQTTYKANLQYLEDKWGDRRLDELAQVPMEIEVWLNALRSRKHPDRELSRQTRTHIKMLLHHVMQSAARWGFLQGANNPAELISVRRGERPKSRDLVVSPELFKALLEDKLLGDHIKVMAQVAMFTGLRASEFLGLKWEDVDLHGLTIHVRRSVVGDHIAPTKTPSSEASVYITQHLADVLAHWKKTNHCFGGWVFGSARTERPFHEMTLQSKHLRPAGARAMLKLNPKADPASLPSLGWHSFRHTYRANLRDMTDAPIEIQSQMMRHSAITMTERYGRHSAAKIDRMREANAALVKRVTGTEG